MSEEIKSRRGVYYDVTKSPYVYESPYGDLFRFSSSKKLAMYTRDITKELGRLTAALERNGLHNYLAECEVKRLHKLTYMALYRKIER